MSENWDDAHIGGLVERCAVRVGAVGGLKLFRQAGAVRTPQEQRGDERSTSIAPVVVYRRRTKPRGLEARDSFPRMTAAPEPNASDPSATDASRRTWLAAERTWLAWWRTGLGATAAAVAVGRILPGLSGGARWPLKALGLGYGALAVAILVIGGVRQTRVSAALRRGSYDQLSDPLVMWLTASAVVLAIATIVVIAVAF